MFWRQKQGWYGSQLEKNLEGLRDGDYSRISWIFCVFSENHDLSKLEAARALSKTLPVLIFDDIIRIDEQMRQTTSIEWGIDWSKLDIENFFTYQMNDDERRALIVFASFNPNGFIRERAVRLMSGYDGTLPYIILRQNDWAAQVRQAASVACQYRLCHLSKGEILAALPFADKLKRSGRARQDGYDNLFLLALTSPENERDLMAGLEDSNIRTRRICIDAMFSVPRPNMSLAFKQMTREPDPFLRSTIFEKLVVLGQNMDEAIREFLRDKYPANRLLAFRYLLNIHADNRSEIARDLLLDKSAAVRTFAQDFIREQLPDFDFREFYHNHLNSHTIAAILGLGEKGLPCDAEKVEGYLGDARVGVVKAAMASLMRLDSEKYCQVVTEMLDDSRAGIVKTARNLILKSVRLDYDRVWEIFENTIFEHTRLKCLSILFNASKWSRLTYMLKALKRDEETIRAVGLASINSWLAAFNNSFTLPSKQQGDKLRQLIGDLKGILPPSVEKELLFAVPHTQ
ncbi:MAG: HEAT repeat domain-containing protein [Clostridiales bacterium]|jgi:HEAT repeat protein|nr:HEAT repeat domain-containing protein [Clostridiales bacterium]